MCAIFVLAQESGCIAFGAMKILVIESDFIDLV
jgi:hypothetical protein